MTRRNARILTGAVAAAAVGALAVVFWPGGGSGQERSDEATGAERAFTATAAALATVNATVQAVNAQPREEGVFGPFQVAPSIDRWQQVPCQLPPPGEGRMPQPPSAEDRAHPLFPRLGGAAAWSIGVLRCADGTAWGFTVEGALPVGGTNYSLQLLHAQYVGERYRVQVSTPEGTVRTGEVAGRPALFVDPPKELASAPIPPDRVVVVLESPAEAGRPGTVLVVQSNAPEDAVVALIREELER